MLIAQLNIFPILVPLILNRATGNECHDDDKTWTQFEIPNNTGPETYQIAQSAYI